MNSIDISKVINLAKNNKFEIACASFDVIDHIFKIDIPKHLQGNKLAVQALNLLADGNVQYGYDTPENISKLEKAYKAPLIKSFDDPLNDPNAPHHKFKAKEEEDHEIDDFMDEKESSTLPLDDDDTPSALDDEEDLPSSLDDDDLDDDDLDDDDLDDDDLDDDDDDEEDEE